ncbi:MAG: hypothetical protein JWM10_105 [Myxococcaceae bacterium]|nr:hypothetical protein [Myxococcaceae bacterium]
MESCAVCDGEAFKLTPEQEEGILAGLRQLDAGQGIPLAEVDARLRRIIGAARAVNPDRVVFSPLALAELEELTEYIGDRNPDAAERVRAAVISITTPANPSPADPGAGAVRSRR